MNGVASMPTKVHPAAGGEVAPPPLQEVRRPTTETVGAVEPVAKAAVPTATDRKGLEKMVKEANSSLSAMTSLHISLDEDHNRMVVQVMDKSDNNKVIRQIPSENVLELSKRIDALRELKGFFLDTKA